MKGEKVYPAMLAVRLGADAYADFVANAERSCGSKEIALRDLVRAFNELCADGTRVVLPLRLVSPAYRIVGDRVVDASPVYPLSGDAEERLVAEINEVEAMADADDARRAQAEAAARPAPAAPPILARAPRQLAKAPASGASRPESGGKKPATTQVGTGRGVA